MKIAIIGASTRRDKFGNKCVRAYQQNGDTVFPIHPAHGEIEGLQAYPSVLEVPDEIEVASFYVAPAVGLKVLEECAQKNIKTVWLNPGAQSDAILQRAEELGIETEMLCSIRHIGRSPSEF
jgi:predicted CoA-binding protein